MLENRNKAKEILNYMKSLLSEYNDWFYINIMIEYAYNNSGGVFYAQNRTKFRIEK